MKVIIRETDIHGSGKVIVAAENGDILKTVDYDLDENFTTQLLSILQAIRQYSNFTLHAIGEDDLDEYLAKAPIPENI
jgi:hypothetical protein